MDTLAFCSAKWWTPRYRSLGTTIRISIFYGAKLLMDVAILPVKILCGYSMSRPRSAPGDQRTFAMSAVDRSSRRQKQADNRRGL